MMIVKKILAATAAVALVTAPTMAAASNAGALSVRPAAENLGSEGESALEDGGTIWAFLLGGVILTGFILAVIEESDDDGSPVSP